MSFYEYFQTLQVFRVHTNQHAGNMHREMCAYITGCHDGTHGEGIASLVQEEFPELYELFGPIVAFVPDENGYHRCSTIVPSPSDEDDTDAYHSVGIFFSERPEEGLLEMASERARAYARKQGQGAFDDLEGVAKFGALDIEVLGTDFVTYDLREGMEVLWKK